MTSKIEFTKKELILLQKTEALKNLKICLLKSC